MALPLDQVRWWTHVSTEFAENCYVLSWPDHHRCIVVDPGLQIESILELLQMEGLTPALILNTHGHADHIAGNEYLKAKWPAAPLVIGAGDAEMLIDPVQNLSAAFGLPVTSPPADQLVRHGDIVATDGWEFEVREAPGHSPGHVVYVCRQTSPNFVLGGDVLFQGSVGRTDFPGGSFEQLKTSIRTQLYSLPDETVVFSGHGPPTTTGREKRTNTFVRGAD